MIPNIYKRAVHSVCVRVCMCVSYQFANLYMYLNTIKSHDILPKVLCLNVLKIITATFVTQKHYCSHVNMPITEYFIDIDNTPTL